MSDKEIRMIVSRLDRIDNRLEKLQANAVTWKMLLAAAAVITALVTLGNQMWG